MPQATGTPISGRRSVRPMSRCSRRSFADVPATWALLQQTTERASKSQTPQQALALQLFFDGQPMAAIAARLGLRS